MIIRRILLILLLLFTARVDAQHQHEPSSTPEKEKTEKQQTQHQHHEMDHGNPASRFLMNQAAGTAANPASSSVGMQMHKTGNWNLMTHGYAFLNFIGQSGPRGEDDLFSTNHLMFIGERQTSPNSSFLVRTMLSLEPATVQDGRYPLLFQTGETADDGPIVDGQHPHDLFMELSAQYALQLNPDTLIHLYAGLRGDPALGPVAFPHRFSAGELPQAVLSHHLQDSTHIADNVLTAGIQYREFRVEFSGFHGAEPDEDRWDLDPGAIDSWSARFTYAPTANWTSQVSTGRLKEPEELEPGDIHRTTLSVSYNQPRSDGFWTSTFAWGWNHKLAVDLDVYSLLFETLWQFRHKNYLTGRFEIVDKEELFADHQGESPVPAEEVFRIKAFTFGYARDFDLIPRLQTGIGANMTIYSTPDALEPFYGNGPKGFFLYFRIRYGHH